MLFGLESPVVCWSIAFPFGDPSKGVQYIHLGPWGLHPLHGLWLCWTASSSSEVLAEYSGLDRVWTGRSWQWSAWLHFFILHARWVTFHLVTVRIHNDFMYLIRRQQTGQFSMRSLTTFHFAADRNTPPPILQQNFSCLQTIICKLALRKSFFPLPSKHLLACYKNLNGFTTQKFHSLRKIQEYTELYLLRT